MEESALAQFRDFVLRVRAETISNFEGYLSGHYKNEHAQAIAAAYIELKSRPELLQGYFLPEIVDEVLVIFLQALHESNFDLNCVSL